MIGSDEEGDFSLQIENVNLDDDGIFQCQGIVTCYGEIYFSKVNYDYNLILKILKINIQFFIFFQNSRSGRWGHGDQV